MIKGIPNESFIQGNLVSAHLFHFESNEKRKDDFDENSINWHDDDKAIDFTLNQMKEDGLLQFKYGYAILPRRRIDNLNNLQSINNSLSYERRINNGNIYHGNILLKKGFQKANMKKIAASIALQVSQIIPR